MDMTIAPTITACVTAVTVNHCTSTVERNFWDFDQWCAFTVTRTADAKTGALWTFEAFATVNGKQSRILHSVGNAEGYVSHGIDLAIEMAEEAIVNYRTLRGQIKAMAREEKMERKLSK